MRRSCFKTWKGAGWLGLDRREAPVASTLGHAALCPSHPGKGFKTTSNNPYIYICRALLLATTLVISGCTGGGSSDGKLEAVWGRHGISAGRLQKPRAMAIDDKDQLYIVDMTARIQVFTRDGEFIRGWQTPEHERGRPTGLSIGRDGNVLV